MSPTVSQALKNEITRLKFERDSLRRSTRDVYGVMGNAYKKQLDGLDSQIQELQEHLANKG